MAQLAKLAVAGVGVAVIWWRNRARTSLDGQAAAADTHYFGSEFSDVEILTQLASVGHQTSLDEHGKGSDSLHAHGPDFMKLAVFLLGRSPAQPRASLEDGLRAQRMDAQLVEYLVTHGDAVVRAMVAIAESYLARGRSPPSTTDASEQLTKGVLPTYLRGKVLEGRKGFYRPLAFLAKGSGGEVYSACRARNVLPKFSNIVGGPPHQSASSKRLSAIVKKQMDKQLVLKRIAPAQKDSAEHEYRIATKLNRDPVGGRFCVPYLDRMEGAEALWLLLRRIPASVYGIDLSEYIQADFFLQEENILHSQSMVCQLIKGLQHIAEMRVMLRDVKADNVLVYYNDFTDEYTIKWADFGLAVDLDQIRRPIIGSSPEDLTRDLVGFWYDTQKLVPRPKWEARRPPERCYQEPETSDVHCYDTYMLGIMFVSMATCIDFAHLADAKYHYKERAEEFFGKPFSPDFLKTFSLAEAMEEFRDQLLRVFQRSFGADFGSIAFELASDMLSETPSRRPSPSHCIDRLGVLFRVPTARSTTSTPVDPPSASSTGSPESSFA